MADDTPDLEAFRRAVPQRIVRTDGARRNFVVKGGRNEAWTDVYHNLLTMPWWGFVAMTAGIYLAVNLVFAVLYWPDAQGLNDFPVLKYIELATGKVAYTLLWTDSRTTPVTPRKLIAAVNP